MTNHDKELRELFRLASLIGCDPRDEERHRADLLNYITTDRERACREARIDEVVRFREAMINHSTPMNYAPARIATLSTQEGGKDE